MRLACDEMIAFVEIPPYPALYVQWSWKVQPSIETDGIPVTTQSHESQLLSSNTNIETEDIQASLMSINLSKRLNLNLHQNTSYFPSILFTHTFFPKCAVPEWLLLKTQMVPSKGPAHVTRGHVTSRMSRDSCHISWDRDTKFRGSITQARDDTWPMTSLREI